MAEEFTKYVTLQPYEVTQVHELIAKKESPQRTRRIAEKCFLAEIFLKVSLSLR